MTRSNRFTAPLALAATLALPIVVNGCGDDITNPAGALCCTDFKVGADLSTVDFGVDASIKGQYVAFAQASADLAATAQAAVDDVAGACRAIAQAGGANADKEEPTDGKERVKFWCGLAVGRIDGAFKAAGGLGAFVTINVQPAQCRASFKAEANCNASCDVSGTCDVKAKPPTCEGGQAKLEISCEGSCEGSAGASISCEGSCTGTCSGSCTAQGGVAVDCDGSCDGQCAAGGSAGGSGLQADGTCKGQCQGTCTARAQAPALRCSGSCKGQCNAKCEASAGARVKCDGKCSNESSVQPISCKGGQLKAQCDVDANCSANCRASAEAKAECTPPRVDINAKAGAQVTAEAAVIIDALRLNLPQILLIVQARGQAFADLVLNVSGSGAATLKGGPDKLGVKGTACLGAIVPAVVAAADNAKASVEAAISVQRAIGGS